MATPIFQRAPKRAQDGSAGPVVVILALAVLVWWQWDWIAGLFGSKLSMGGATVAEVVDYRCEKQSDGRAVIEGRIRNVSTSAISLRAVTAIYDSSGKKSDYRESSVRTVQPGQEGSFRSDGASIPDGGYCKLDGIVDSDTGKPVRFTGGRR